MSDRTTQRHFSKGVLRGLAYASGVFAIGFAFGVLRALVAASLKWTERHLLIAESCEIVAIVVVAWRLCRPLCRELSCGQRATMALTTLLALLTLEAGVGLWLLELSWRQYLHHFATLRGGLSLFGYTLVSLACIAPNNRGPAITSHASL